MNQAAKGPVFGPAPCCRLPSPVDPTRQALGEEWLAELLMDVESDPDGNTRLRLIEASEVALGTG